MALFTYKIPLAPDTAVPEMEVVFGVIGEVEITGVVVVLEPPPLW